MYTCVSWYCSYTCIILTFISQQQNNNPIRAQISFSWSPQKKRLSMLINPILHFQNKYVHVHQVKLSNQKSWVELVPIPLMQSRDLWRTTRKWNFKWNLLQTRSWKPFKISPKRFFSWNLTQILNIVSKKGYSVVYVTFSKIIYLHVQHAFFRNFIL